VDAGGRFYFAKDAVLRPADVLRAFGRERIDAFLALKARLDPEDVLMSDLWRRIIERPPLVS
jgi:decaprenylphospho-beta-D-ribofuranose 2-oxidase